MASESQLTPTPTSRLTARERRRRIVLLVLLLLLLALVSLATYQWVSNRRAPVPRLAREGDLLPPPEYLYSITGTGSNALDSPVGVDVAENGRVFVVDFNHNRVSAFTSNGRFLFSFNETSDGELYNPVHLQVLGDEVWVTDRRRRALYIFDLDGNFIRKFEPQGEEDLLWTPLALAFDKDGALRATDVAQTDKHRLMYFSADESRTVTVGKTGQVTDVEASPGSFYFPNGLAVASDGRVFVSDGDNRRVQVFDDMGEYQGLIDTSGVPRGLAIDDQDRLYVVDALAHTVDVYDLDGKPLTQFGTRGFGPGQFNFPNDVAIDSRGRIFITDRENDQVQVWAWPTLTVPATVVPTEPWQWALCFTPLLFLPLLLLLRKRTYVLTPEFLAALVEVDRTDVLDRRRLRFVAPERDRSAYDNVAFADVDVERVIRFEEHSTTDAAALQDRLRCTEAEAAYLTMADRSRGLLSEDVDLRRLGLIAKIRVLDVREFLNDISAGEVDRPGPQ